MCISKSHRCVAPVRFDLCVSRNSQVRRRPLSGQRSHLRSATHVSHLPGVTHSSDSLYKYPTSQFRFTVSRTTYSISPPILLLPNLQHLNISAPISSQFHYHSQHPFTTSLSFPISFYSISSQFISILFLISNLFVRRL